MSLELSNLILHQITKNSDETFSVVRRNNPLNLDDSSQHFVAELHRVYSAKAGKGFAGFKTESACQQWLGQLLKNELPFYDFSVQCAERLYQELSKYPFAQAGILVLAQYRSLATDYLFIGLLNRCDSLKVTDDLDIHNSDYLDVAKMDIAARIDLSSWQTEPESNRYLTFIKGRVGRKVGDFFLDFLEAENGMDTKVQNQVLLQAVEDFCTDARIESNERQDVRKQVYEYCNGQLKAGEEVDLKELSDSLPDSPEGSDFAQFTAAQGYELEESFPADRSTIRKLTKFVGAGGGISINFDSMLLGDRIFYDPKTDTLTIQGTPPNLRDQLQRRQNLDD
ncbi:Nucleoid-associated protein YejK [Vibrio stylophorae]|uniref:Nucleoid-associated protein VST7929_00925 n=1 Tax=Vibrio stylophorae TaxID=659351 RepID=A0ABN8DR02_9VIBR|nr:nucleoid-associated protein YejK [Vibrio stylophorae]CAH0533072.1 Nucleoid-associated protein YejK [Vibrio stylophorae]